MFVTAGEEGCYKSPWYRNNLDGRTQGKRDPAGGWFSRYVLEKVVKTEPFTRDQPYGLLSSMLSSIGWSPALIRRMGKTMVAFDISQFVSTDH